MSKQQEETIQELQGENKEVTSYKQKQERNVSTLQTRAFESTVIHYRSQDQKISSSLPEDVIKNMQNAADAALESGNKLNKHQKKERAAKKYEEALKLFEQIANDEQVAKISQKLHNIYTKLGDQDNLQKINIFISYKAFLNSQIESHVVEETVKKEATAEPLEEKVEKNLGSVSKHARLLVRDITNFEEIPVKDASNVRVVSYNIIADFFDNKDKTPDHHHHWNYRAPFVKQLLTFNHPDVFCLQELSANQAIEMENFFCKLLGYKAMFLVQTPSQVEAGVVAFDDEVHDWRGKDTGTFLTGTFVSKDWTFTRENVGKFWLNENPDQVPENTDRGVTDKGFGNMNTYRAVLWVKIENHLHESLFVFNSHYPLDGASKTRFECARIEMQKIAEITKGERWVSMGDRNIIRGEKDNDLYNPETIYREFIKSGYDVRDSGKHYGVSTTWLGFTYDSYKNPVLNGDFQNNIVLDIMVSNMRPQLSFSHPGAIEEGVATGTMEGSSYHAMQLASLGNPIESSQNDEYRFASDHCLIGGDFALGSEDFSA